MRRVTAKKQMSVARILFTQLRLTVKAIPLLFGVYAIISALQGIFWGANTLATQLFFDAVTKAVQGNVTVQRVLLMAALLGGVTVFTHVLNGVNSYLGFRQSREVSGVLSRRLHEKAARIDPVCFEDPDLLDDINKAREGMNKSLGMQGITTALVTFYIPYFAFMAVYLYSLQPMLVLAIVMVFLPVFISQLIRSTVFTKLEDQAAPIRREYEYYERCICDREYFKETRLLGAARFFQGLYLTALRDLATKTFSAELRTTLLELSMRVLTLCGYGGILLLLFSGLMRGEISVGAFAAVFASVDRMFIMMEEIITTHIGGMTQNLGTVRNAMRFLDLPERYGASQKPNLELGISLQDVSFRYPGANQNAIRKVSLSIHPGETVAIVGENGSGKTTLVRLLTGLFLPTQGRVDFGGCPTAEIAPHYLFNQTSAVFQKYQRYKLTLGENVAISNLDQDYDDAHVLQAARQADVPVDSFPEGTCTMLSREFGGTDLSGGQWQRVAVARAFYRDHQLVVLDEPTAAIDPLEESRIYEQFAGVARGKTAIIVTHRLGSARVADRIVVMDRGSIVGVGTHDELMQADGKYAELYQAQAQWYQ